MSRPTVEEARAALDPDAGRPMAPFVAATLRELERLGAVGSMLGEQALVIAKGMARGDGSELATLSKEHGRLMAAIAKGDKVTADPLDVVGDVVAEKRARAARRA